MPRVAQTSSFDVCEYSGCPRAAVAPVGFGDALWRYEIAAGPLTRQLTDTLSRRERAGVNGVAI